MPAERNPDRGSPGAVENQPLQPSYRGLQTSIFAGAFVFGVVMSSLGSVLPALFAAVGFQKVDAGRLFLFMNFGMLVSSLLFGPICDRFGFRVLLLSSTALVGGAFGGLAVARSYGVVAGSLVILGLGGGALNGGTNALLNDISPERRATALNRLGIYFGFGALCMPFLIGALLESAGLERILSALALLTTVPLILLGIAGFPLPKHRRGISGTEFRSLLRSPLLYLFGALLLFQSGNEFTMGGWISTYLGERIGFEPRIAAYVLALYWAAMMIGRWGVSRIGVRIPPARLVIASAVVALVSAGLLPWTTNGIVAAAAVTGVGLGFAAIFPTVLAEAGGVFADYSGSAFSVIFVMALSGGMTAPWLFGQVSQSHGVGRGFWITVVSCAMIIILQAAIRRRMDRNSCSGVNPSQTDGDPR
jgi:MFS transporter, FHS family, glucose/mannose:H+ symporter